MIAPAEIYILVLLMQIPTIYIDVQTLTIDRIVFKNRLLTRLVLCLYIGIDILSY